MRRRIFHAILITAVAVLLLCGVLFSLVIHHSYEEVYFAEIRSEAHTITCALDQGLAPQTLLPELKRTGAVTMRITWIGADGTVLYDSTADAAAMENHAAREEVAGALAEGSAQTTRQSATVSRVTYYYASRLTDGTVLRISGEVDSVWGLFLEILRPMALVLILALLLGALLAFRVAKRVLRPILTIDLEHPEQAETFDELTPLLERIHAQNRQIAAQMRELRRRQEEFDAVTEHMSEGLLIVDSEANLLSCNTSARRLLHIQNADTASVLAVNHSPGFRQAVEEALAGGHSFQTLTLDGRIYQLVANPVYDQNALTGAVLVLLDVTEREDRERLRREFSANVSHELRTPLTSISGFAELIREGLARPEDVPHFAGNICREAQRLLTLIEDILRLSQLDEDGGDTERSPQALDAIARTVVEQLLPTAGSKSVSLQLESEPCQISGVYRILEELIFNLCDNAIKYNRPGGSVLVCVHREGDDVRLSVSDTGIGIPAADQERVFERFYRVDKSHSKAIGGTGLGLSIVKHAAAFHRAEVSLRSEPGQGTIVDVRFPGLG